MADALQNALSAYGAVGVFAQSNPELLGKLNEAVANGWDAARFERELWTTNWYKSLSDNQQQLQVLQATDPAQYNQQIALKASLVQQKAAGLGLTVNAGDIAQQALWNNWSDADLSAHLVDQGQVRLVGGTMTGTGGEVENHLRNTFESYGLQMGDDWYQMVAREVLAGRQTLGGMDNEAVMYASGAYPQYAQAFKEGRTLSDISKPYIQAMSQTLELDPSAINLQDPTIQKALQGDGKTPMTMWQFNQNLKADPRWAKTDGAKNAAYDTVAQIGKDWGFL